MGGGPSIEAPKPQPKAVTTPEVDIQKLALQRRTLALKRAGIRSLRIDRNPGVAGDSGVGGMGIPGV